MLTREQRQMLIKYVKYSIKRAQMSRNYEGAKGSAIEEYSKLIANPTLQKLYSHAWSSMPKHYDEAITDPNIIRRVIRNYAKAMFNVELSEKEIDELLDEMAMMMYRG